MAPKRRFFNGLSYIDRGWTNTHAAARKAAKRYRERGMLTRIAPGLSREGDKGFRIYTRRPR